MFDGTHLAAEVLADQRLDLYATAVESFRYPCSLCTVYRL
jgi:hypothetical protein